MTFQHAVLWMDHRQALLIGLARDPSQRKLVRNDHHEHRDRDSLGSRTEHDRVYFSAIADMLGQTPEVLLLGAGPGRIDFLTWLKAHHPDQARHILENRAWEYHSDEELVKEAHRFFKAADRMLPAAR